MITKAQVKDIRALVTAKGRAESGAYLVEGDKLAKEWLGSSLHIRQIVALPEWLEAHRDLLTQHPEAEVIPVKPEELGRVSTQQAPSGVLLVVPISPVPQGLPVSTWSLVLDTIQDPGNLGTIIRIADWFGIGHIVCSPGCADFYNPKVVAAGMGGHLRVQLHQADLPSFLADCTVPVLAATLDGAPVNGEARFEQAALLIGNESRGVHPDLLRFASKKLCIPRRGGAESLNAAVATGILLALIGPT